MPTREDDNDVTGMAAICLNLILVSEFSCVFYINYGLKWQEKNWKQRMLNRAA